MQLLLPSLTSLLPVFFNNITSYCIQQFVDPVCMTFNVIIKFKIVFFYSCRTQDLTTIWFSTFLSKTIFFSFYPSLFVIFFFVSPMSIPFSNNILNKHEHYVYYCKSFMAVPYEIVYSVRRPLTILSAIYTI